MDPPSAADVSGADGSAAEPAKPVVPVVPKKRLACLYWSSVAMLSDEEWASSLSEEEYLRRAAQVRASPEMTPPTREYFRPRADPSSLAVLCSRR